MARAAGKDDDGGENGRDEVSRALHELSNTLHALNLRIFALHERDLPQEARIHLEAARRLSEQSSHLVAELRGLREATPPPERPRPLTRGRNPR
jgi:hypothetical protein